MPKHPQHPSHRRSPHSSQAGRHEGARRSHNRRRSPEAPDEASQRWNAAPGDNPGTLTDEDYLSAGGPDALDSATAEDAADLPADRRGRLP